jgi:hypothetical protein
MRLPGLRFPAVLVVALFSVFPLSALLAQHGGGGSSAGSSSASSSASSGGFHGGGGTSSVSSSGGHSSSGSASHTSGSHTSGSQSSTARSTSSRSYTFRGLDQKGNVQAPKRGFVSFLRHPFVRRPNAKSKQLTQFRRRVCLNGTCRVCPVAQVPGAAGCVTPHIYLRHSNVCSRADVWAGSACLLQVSFADDCAGPRMAMEQQARRVREAAAARASECANLFSQQCADLTNNEQRESSLYQVMQDKYKQCEVRSRGTAWFGHNPFLHLGAGNLVMDADHQLSGRLLIPEAQ